MISNKHPFVSYAQNHEDVLLWRLFQNMAEGFYVDVGAAHPEWESVTKAFYDRGWRGINLEPNTHFYAMLEKERPRDINIRALAGRETGERELHIVGQSGLSTASLENVDFLSAKGHAISHQETCKMVRLDDVFREYQAPRIQFLKVDAEGMEQEVLEGCSFSEFRPEVLVIEATLPETNTRREDGVREYLSSRDYQFAFFDGLNDFYVAAECVHLEKQLLWPVNFIDNYIPANEIYLKNRLAKTLQLRPQKRKFLFSDLFNQVRSFNRKKVAPLHAEDVIWAYRHFLGREPESSEVVDDHIAVCKDFRHLVEVFTSSNEYQFKKMFTGTKLI